MGRWLDLANSLETGKGAGDDRDVRDNSSSGRSNVPNVPIVLPPSSPRDRFIEWDEGVASLNLDKPLGGYAPDHWRRIVRDCDNLIADFGNSAAALGWSTIDLFGFDPAGGIVAGLIRRLDGGRIIAMDENRATYRWPFSDRTSWLARGYLENCLALRFVPVWELAE